MGFDTWFSSGDRKGEAIAEIVEGAGDVRVKFNQEVRWQAGRVSQKLQYNDAIFAGEESQVKMKVGGSQLQLKSNTMVILRKENLFNSLNLSYGGLKGLMAKDEKLIIETANGEKFEIKADAASKIAIDSNAGKTSIRVVEGNASLTKDGKKQSLSSRDQVEFTSQKRNDPLVFRLPDRAVSYSYNAEERVHFDWAYQSGRRVGGIDEFSFEASNDPAFKLLSLREQIIARQNLESTIPVPSDLYYRVKDKSGAFSETRRLRLLRPQVPSIMQPAANAVHETEAGQSYKLSMRLSEPQPQSKLWLQIARDPEFNDLIERKTLIDPTASIELPIGQYYLRAKAEFNQLTSDGTTLQTEWSETRPVLVRERIGITIAQSRISSSIIIPNLNYPAALYRAPELRIQEHLAQTPQFSRFFERQMASGHELVVSKAGEPDAIKLSGPGFPATWIQPGLSRISYHLESLGQVTVAEKSQPIRIEMEAPNRLSATREEGLSWSPILFAKAYEGELRLAGGEVKKFVSQKPNYMEDLPVNREHGFRVRALGEEARPISGWSEPYTFTYKPAPPPPVQTLAQSEEPSQAREPAEETSTSVLKIDERKLTAWEKVGYWIWMGTGVNFFDVRQTVSNTADVAYKNIAGPSFFAEAGYMAKSRLGAIFGYKRTPGEVRIENYPVNKREFVWDTYSLEGIFGLPWASRILNHTINWGLRAGVQQHSFPFLYIETGRNVINSQSEMTAASLGFFLETTGRWKQHMHMRWQQPIASSTTGGNSFEIQPRMAFDGSVGTSYLLTERLKTGLFWYGQMHNYNFTYRSATQSNSGYQSLFYSNMELRLGLDF